MGVLISWWRHSMGAPSTSLACVIRIHLHKSLIMQSCDVFVVVGMNKLLNKQFSLPVIWEALKVMPCHCNVSRLRLDQRTLIGMFYIVYLKYNVAKNEPATSTDQSVDINLDANVSLVMT